MILPGPNNRFSRTTRGIIYGWVVGLVLLLFPYTEDPAAPIKHLATTVAAILACTVWAAGVACGRTPFHRPQGKHYLMLAFLASQVLAAALSSAPLRSFDALQFWFGVVLVSFIASQVFTEIGHLRNLLRVVVFAVAASSVYAFAQYAGVDPFPWGDRMVEEYRNLPATYGNPNLAGHVLVIALVLVAGLIANAWKRGSRKLEPCVYAILACVLLGHLYLTGMRSGAMALCFAGLFAIVATVLATRGVRPQLAGVVALCLAGALLSAAAVALVVLAPSLHLDSSLQLRLNGYAGAVAMFHDHLLTGVGPGAYAVENMAYWTDFEALWYALENKRNFNAHNEWLEVAVASGLVGLAAFIGLVLVGILAPFRAMEAASVRSRALMLALPVALVAMVVDACTGFNLHAPVSGALFFLLVALAPSTSPMGARLMGYRRMLPALLVPLALLHGHASWRQFESARNYQMAQGAMVWAQAKRASGDLDAARYGDSVARERLLEAAQRTPWDYKVYQSAGDLELARENFRDAATQFGLALECAPHHPLLHVQRARALLRLSSTQRDAERTQTLDAAEHHATLAKGYCPELAEAAAMLGWVHYYRAEGAEAAVARTPLTETAAAFERARALGHGDDLQLRMALGNVYGRLERFAEAARILEGCVLEDSENSALWTELHAVAIAAGGDWPLRYRQALLHELQGQGSVKTTLTISDLAARLSEARTGEATDGIIREVLATTLERLPGRLELWGAWLNNIATGDRESALAERANKFTGTMATLPPFINRLAALGEAPDSAALDAVCDELLDAVTTAPGGTRSGPVARALLPLLDLVEHVAVSTHLMEGLSASSRANLGAAYFEAGAYAKADALLRVAEQQLPVADRGMAQYYRSRSLLALDQPAAALALAKQASHSSFSGAVERQWQLVRCMVASGETDAAIYLYESMVSHLPVSHPYRAPIERELAALLDAPVEAMP